VLVACVLAVTLIVPVLSILSSFVFLQNCNFNCKTSFHFGLYIRVFFPESNNGGNNLTACSSQKILLNFSIPSLYESSYNFKLRFYYNFSVIIPAKPILLFFHQRFVFLFSNRFNAVYQNLCCKLLNKFFR
jgi:hypothetical protein